MFRRSLRTAFHLTTALSLVLLLVAALLWGRSYYRLDQLTWVSDGDGVQVTSVAGTLHVGSANHLLHGSGLRCASSPLPGFTRDWRWVYPGVRRQSEWLGFAGVEGAYDLGQAWVPFRMRIVPYPAVILPLAGLPAWALVQRLRRHRRPGLCPRCGYDLRASKDRCPECGTPIPEKLAKAPS